MSTFWQNFHHWLHWKLSFWQLPVQPVMKILSKLHLCVSVYDLINNMCTKDSELTSTNMELYNPIPVGCSWLGRFDGMPLLLCTGHLQMETNRRMWLGCQILASQVALQVVCMTNCNVIVMTKLASWQCLVFSVKLSWLSKAYMPIYCHFFTYHLNQ